MAERAFNDRTHLSDTAPFRRLDFFRFGGSPDVIARAAVWNTAMHALFQE
jgi:hypothetical protein